MWYTAAVTTAPVAEPISIEEARAQTRWGTSTANDVALNIYIKAARAHAEAYCGTPLAARTIAAKCDGFADFEAFPVVPLQSVVSITYVDPAGAEQTLSDTVYEVEAGGLSAAIWLRAGQSWPAIQPGSRITVSAAVGYPVLPDDIKYALLLMVAQGDSDREAEFAGAHALLCNHRVYA